MGTEPLPGRDAARRRPTLAEVAQHASVAESTVSKVLNGRPGITPALRARVESSLHQLGYRRRGGDATPGALIELVVDRMSSQWSLDVFRGVQQVALEHRTAIILTERARRDPGEDWIDGVIQRHPLGLVLALSQLTSAAKRQLQVRGVPFVIVDPAALPDGDSPAVASANWEGGWMATRHLVALGHRRIAAVTMPTSLLFARARLSGYHAALEETGVEIDPALIVTTGSGRDDGLAAGLRLLAMTPRPTAIVASTDLQAIGLYEAARQCGLSIPGDLSIVGYDDMPAAEWLAPPLTTVRQPVVQMAEQAARMLFTLIAGRPLAVSRLTLDVALIERGSTAAPPR
ncbi:LacI family DNA-binding transcriptional regulator [Microcella sp.]|uniref:LacI family DNA-binding transcriptional regulator n=1 Tax=Microcella sp. TaxID=1913979 RepID=UPI003F71E54C